MMRKRKAAFFLLLLLILCCMGVQAKEKGSSPEEMEVHFIDVGQADATLIRCGEASMLIDAGNNDQGTYVQNYLKKQGVKKLDYLIVTHPDADHSGGADVIITKYDTDTIILPDCEKDTRTWRDVLKAIDYKNKLITRASVGDTYQLGSAEFTIIAPGQKDYDNNTNNYSVGIVLRHGDKKFLFTGDAEEEAEEDILHNGVDIGSVDVYKVAHHGSRTSSSRDLLETIMPGYAVISCGEGNEYGHPHASTMNALRRLKTKVFRTDEQGSVVAVSDGRKIRWNCAPSESWKAGEPAGSSVKEKSGKPDSPAVQEKAVGRNREQSSREQDDKSLTFVLNKKTLKFHRPACNSLPTANREDSTQSREEIIEKGYAPCKKCDP